MMNIWELSINFDIFKYFYPKSVTDSEGISAIEKKYDSKLILFILSTMLFFATIVLYFILQAIGFKDQHFVPPVVVIVLTGLSFLQYKLTGKTTVFVLQVFVFQYILTTQRILILQSHSWAMLVWTYVIFSIAALTVNYTIAVVGFLLNTLSVVYFIYAGDQSVGFLSREIQIFVNIITPIAFYFMIISYKNKVDASKLKAISKYQQKDSISKMTITLCHEINNPLTISKLSISRLKKRYSEQAVQRCLTGLDRITKITHLIKDIQELDEVDYGDQSLMYNLYDKIKEENDNDNGDSDVSEAVNEA